MGTTAGIDLSKALYSELVYRMAVSGWSSCQSAANFRSRYETICDIIRFISLLHVLCLCAFAQDPTKSVERNLWHSRADVLTHALLKDASNIDALDRAVLMAQLSALWWESERTPANTWLEKSVDTIAFYPDEEVKAQRERFFRVTRQVLALISTHNKKQSTRLVRILSAAENDIPDKEKKLNAEALIEQALRIVKTDAPQATKLGLLGLALDFPPNAYKLAWDLRRYNSDLANQFFRVALSNVSTAPQTAKLYGLQRIAFPEHGNPNFPAQFLPPRESRISFLNFVAEYLHQRQLAFSSKTIRSCADEAVFTTGLKDSFTEVLPQKSQMVEQAIEICLSNLKPQTKQLLDPKNAETNNFEGLLKQADGIQGDPLLRGRYLLNAALVATQQKKFALSVQVLDKMNDEERKVDFDFWQDLRLDSGVGLAVAEFKEGDVPRASKTLKDLPDALRALGQITFVSQIPQEDVSCSQFCTDLLNEARRDIVKSDLLFVRKSSYWLNLVKLYSGYKQHTEAADAFKEMVKAFNAAKTRENAANNGALSSRLIADTKRIIPGFSLTLFETKEDSMFDSIRLLNDERVRKQINLELLRMILHKYQSLKVEPENRPAATNKAQNSP